MAIPTRSARTTGFGEKSTTPATVGPGSYLGTGEKLKTRPSLAAFSSSEPRSWQEKAVTCIAPGPGSYIGPNRALLSENECRRTYCFESKAPRLAPQYTGSTQFAPSSAVQVPGPGAYEAIASPGLCIQRDSHRVSTRQKSASVLPRRFNPPSVPRWVSPLAPMNGKVFRR